MIPPVTLAITMKTLDTIAAVGLVVGVFMALLALFWIGQAVGLQVMHTYLWLRRRWRR